MNKCLRFGILAALCAAFAAEGASAWEGDWRRHERYEAHKRWEWRHHYHDGWHRGMYVPYAAPAPAYYTPAPMFNIGLSIGR